jgi:predicted alpha-1,2-mannosidase
VAAAATGPLARPAGAAAAGQAGTSLASLVNPFAGTGKGTGTTGSIGEFPGADVPFGMLQWSPDTSPDRVTGSGYSSGDSAISGFSLTHLSGDGCPAFGDIPILPTTGPLGSDPAVATEPFSHADESAAPGRYQVALGTPRTTVQVAVTTRTGLSRLAFPPTASANVLFKVSDSAGTVHGAAVRVVGDDEVVGQVTDGGFCTTGTYYTLYFTARFDRDFAGAGTWDGSAVTAGSRACTGTGCGAWVSFDAQHDRTVMMKVGISYVSAADATANLEAEDPGWSLAKVESAATARWDAVLGRVSVAGGALTERRTFETALYHSLLYPSVGSDDNGEYIGDDGRVHRSTPGAQYVNFSEWDIYRSEIPLLCLAAPRQVGQMVQSLVNDAEQGGWLPKWAMVDGDLSQMNGDSADPIIASAYAFGIRDFDAKAALAAMVKGATETETPHGLEVERQYLSQYLSQHYVDAGNLDLDSITYSAGASMTLEYSLDDFSIAQLAAALGDRPVYTSMMARAHNWEYLFNPATGYLQGRQAGGGFPPGPALDPSLFEPGGEQGFEEGNAIQYTWAVPQDLDALSSLMGGTAVAQAKLTQFFAQTNAGRDAPDDWAGNEPSLWTPWEFDYFGAPYTTQSTVRRIMTSLYRDSAVDEPGNDDLGAISSWYVWAALGFYPVTPGTANLAMATPLFPSERIDLPDGRSLVVKAPHAGPHEQFITAVRVSGTTVGQPVATCAATTVATKRPAGGAWDDPWIPAAMLRSGAVLTYSLGHGADARWGAASAERPPSYGTGRLPAIGYSEPSGTVTVPVGSPTTLVLGVQDVAAGGAEVKWTVTTTGSVRVSATGGTFSPGHVASGGASGAGRCAVPAPITDALVVTASAPGSGTIDFTLKTATGVSLPPVVVTVHATG